MQFEKKQTAMLILTILAFIFLGYQVYQIVHTDINSSASSFNVHAQAADPKPSTTQATTEADTQQPQPRQQTIKSQPASPAPAKAMTASAKASIPAPAATTDPAPKATAAVPTQSPQPLDTSSEAFSMTASQAARKQYMSIANQYELAKMQRMLLDEKAAIASAQHRIAVLNKQTATIGGVDTQNDDYSVSSTYKLSYVDQQNGQWSAALSRNGKYATVYVGSVLPNGYKVLEITRKGVVLQNGNHRVLVTFNGAVNIATPAKLKLKKKVIAIAKPKPKVPEVDWHPESLLALTPDAADTMSVSNANVSMPSVVAGTTTKQKPAGLTARDKVLARPPHHYTIQLIGSFDRSVVDQFIASNHVTDSLVVSISSQGRPWYMLLFGNYSSLDDAKQALNELPDAMKVEGPWVRQFQQVQESLRKS